jgi:epoxyqueuosine reductase
VKRRAVELGFDRAGITTLDPVPHADALRHWLAEGMAGTMTYMQRQAGRRLEPHRILPGATRAVVLLKHYTYVDPPRRPGTGRVARYARGRDYHRALTGPLDDLVHYVISLGGGDVLARHYVDHGPVPERELAQRAGLGWIGKNTMLIDPGGGSYTFLATVLTNLDLATDPPFEADRCGSCRLCLDACPTNAFREERVLDSRRCISYLTIEHRDEIPEERWPLMDHWVFGCDICQEVCPWNTRFARETADDLLEYDPQLAALDLDQLQHISDEEFDRRFGRTALERAGAQGMRRNARIAVTNATRDATCPTPPRP